MNRDDWQDHVESLISHRLQPPKSIFDAADHTSSCVRERRYDLFDTKKSELASLKALTKDALALFASSLMEPATRRMMVVQVSFEEEVALVTDAVKEAKQRVVLDPRELHSSGGSWEMYRVRKLD